MSHKPKHDVKESCDRSRRTFTRNNRRSRTSPSDPATSSSNPDTGKESSTTKSSSEDGTINRLLRKISSDDDQERRIGNIRQFKQYIQSRDCTRSQIHRSLDAILTGLQDVYFDRGYKDVKLEAALAMGTIGPLLGSEGQKYFQWIFGRLAAVHSEHIRILFLKALYEALSIDKDFSMRNFIPPLSETIQTVLENADSPQSLIAVVNIILILAKNYPDIFASHFCDTVDILIGWHIDSSQKESLTNFVSKTLVAFHRFWVNDINFSTTLLGHFLEDMEAYAEDLALVINGNEGDPEEYVSKIVALLTVFTTVVDSLGTYLSPGENSMVGCHYLCDLVTRIVQCVENTRRIVFSLSILTAANQCVGSCLTNLHTDIFNIQTLLLDYAVHQLTAKEHLGNDTYWISLLSLTRKLILQVNTKLPISFVKDIFSKRSVLNELKLSSKKTIVKQVVHTVYALLSLKSVDLLAGAYCNVLADLDIATDIMEAQMKLQISEDNKLEVSKTDNQAVTPEPTQEIGSSTDATSKNGELDEIVSVSNESKMTISEIEMQIEDAKAAAMFDVCAVAEIGNTKSSLIGMWALTPSLFNLFHDHLLRFDPSVYANNPEFHYLILQSLYSHCSKHAQFVNSSTLAGPKPTTESSMIVNVNKTTGGHLAAVMRTITRILLQPGTSYDVKALLLRWSYGIVGNIQKSTEICKSEEYQHLFQALVQFAQTSHNNLSLAACQCLAAMLKQACYILPDDMLESCRILSSSKASSGNEKECSQYLNLLCLLPLSVSTKVSKSGRMKSMEPQGQMSPNELHCHLRHSYMSKLPTGTFHSRCFKAVMGYLLFGNKGTDDEDWLEDLYYSCQRLEKDPDPDSNAMSMDNSQSELWFWASWEAAQFCILSKLRTPLGKPQETFTTIETVLKKLASQAKRCSLGSPPFEEELTLRKDHDHIMCHTRVNVLLMFMDHLEKLLYNAYEGCAVAIAGAPRTIRAFFRTNRQTCEEWLLRIRMSLVHIALHAGNPATALRHATNILSDLKSYSGIAEFEELIVHIVEAMVQLRCPEALQGLYFWCKDAWKQKLPFVKNTIDKARGRYEEACKGFMETYETMKNQNEDEVSMNSASPSHENEEKGVAIKTYIAEQVVDCYLRLNSWQDVLDWQDLVQNDHDVSEHVQQSLDSFVDFGLINALSHFDQKDLTKCSNSLKESLTTEIHHSSCWNPKKLMEECERTILAMKIDLLDNKDCKQSLPKVEDCMAIMSNLIHVQSLDSCGQLHADMVAKLAMASSLVDAIENESEYVENVICVASVPLDPDSHDVGTLNQILAMMNFLKIQNKDNKKIQEHILKTRIDLARLSRKQHNYKLGQQLLIQEMQNHTSSELLKKNATSTDLLQVAVVNVADKLEEKYVIRIEREIAKILMATGQPSDALDMISSSVLRCHTMKTLDSKTGVGDLHARSLLTLVKWLQTDPKVLSTCLAGNVPQERSTLAKNLSMILVQEQKLTENEMTVAEDDQVHLPSDEYGLTEVDVVLERLLRLSTKLSPILEKSWFVLAGYCYKWGRKAVDSASNQGCLELVTEQRELIVQLLPKGTKPQEVDAVLRILGQLHSGTNEGDDVLDQDQSQYDDGTETTRRQLLASCYSLQIASDACVDRLLEVWKLVVKRVYHYYKLSANAYFTYLKLSGNSINAKANMDGNITSTLRLLRLLVKHAWELRDVLEHGLAHTPTSPWKGIIPQLFSRLNHPEFYVRQSVSDLLCRVAEDAPHLIVYPAVVGCSSLKITYRNQNADEGLLNNYLAPANEEASELDTTLTDADYVDDTTNNANSQEDEEDESRDILQSCFSAMVQTLSLHNRTMISEVEILVSELRRITLLWDELWLGSLTQYSSDVHKRFNQLEQEVKKAQQNPSLSTEDKETIIKEKHVTLLKPTLYTLDRLNGVTSAPAETVHEHWFQETFGELIQDSVKKLKNPENPENPQANWQVFKYLHQYLQHHTQKRGNLLQLDQISTKLCSFENTVIAMPGSGSNQHVTIKSIHNAVQILPTKTKPKKLIFIGSDGKKYCYLFKGLEDLHLDERIMQFLSIVNNMFDRTHSHEHQYRARHYSVTPLGSRSGLIQWVDGCTPLFALYKRWQHREAMSTVAKQQADGGEQPQQAAANISRPSEIYYRKLAPLLKEKGINNFDNRKEWPVPVMRRALIELQDETPKDLLAKELWCSSNSGIDWWRIVQTFNRSTAVMSMIGYIIGLGDRHLDNVLVDFSTGEVVHIDYNVCFEKGRNLRVPEKVPFRMTQNIQSALGVSGIEGTFRLACEHVIKTMRKGRETLLTLLEAFVYDPLVDWTTGNEGGYAGAFYGGWRTNDESFPSRRRMEREITFSMFSIRVVEMRGEWMKNRDVMQDCVPKLLDYLEQVATSAKEFETLQQKYELLQKVQRMLHDARKDPQHNIRSLPVRFNEYSSMKEQSTGVTEAMKTLLGESGHWLVMYERAFAALKGQGLQQMCTDLSQPLVVGDASHELVTQFMQGAGQTEVITQCEDIWRELSSSLIQRHELYRQCLDIIMAYSTIISEYPHKFYLATRDHVVSANLQQLSEEFTVDNCDTIAKHYSQYWIKSHFGQTKLDQVLQTEAQLQLIVAECNTKLGRVIERRSIEDSRNGDASFMGVVVQQCLTDIHQYIAENGEPGKVAMSGVLVSALCSLCKRYLVMETAATSAGERLMDLTSRDGDWFLDELASMSGNITQLLDLLRLVQLTDPEQMSLTLDSAFHLFTITNRLYCGLQDLNTNFCNVILPESIKGITSQEPSVLRILNDLDQISSNMEMDSESVLSHLDHLIRNAFIGIEQDSDNLTTTIASMRVMYQQLVHPTAEQELTPGQMLLMVFNNLFVRLENDVSDLLNVMEAVIVPDVWRKLDIVREAEGLQFSPFNTRTMVHLKDVFFVKKLLTMQQFFTWCRDWSEGLYDEHPTLLYDWEYLCRPVRQFIGDFVRKQILGLGTQNLGYLLCLKLCSLGMNVSAEIELRDIGVESKVSLFDLCQKSVDVNIKENKCAHRDCSLASTLTGKFDAAWRKQDLAKRLDISASLLEIRYHGYQRYLARYQWYHERAFIQAGRFNQHRANIMSEVQQYIQSVALQETTILNLHEKYTQLEESMLQRLKWASGANPGLASVLANFEQASLDRSVLVENNSKLNTEILNICQSLLRFESLRSMSEEAVKFDETFIQLLDRCKQACTLTNQCTVTVDPSEEALLQLKPLPESEITDAWVQEVLDISVREVKTMHAKITETTGVLEQGKELVKSQLSSIRNILATHHKLMSDIRTILKSMAKLEEHEMDCKGQEGQGSVRDYMDSYKTFSETFTKMLKLGMSEDVTSDMLVEIKTMAQKLKQQIPQIYGDLVRLAPPLIAKKEDTETPSQGTQTPDSQGGVKVRQVLKRKLDKISRDPKTGKAIQERNSYAVGVWRRVRLKLDGRDPDLNTKLSVNEQVDYTIKEAISVDNLCALYEGWTPWV